jgi:hypothetical protein
VKWAFLLLAAPAAFAQVRVEPRALVKEKRWFLSAGASWLERRDYYESPGLAISGAYYLRESDAIEGQLGWFATYMADAGNQIFNSTGLVPDAQKPSSMLLAGWRHSLTYGKVALKESVVHFDVQMALHAGFLVTDRAWTPAADGSLGVLARLGPRWFGQLDLALMLSREQRSTAVFAAGVMPVLTVGVSL